MAVRLLQSCHSEERRPRTPISEQRGKTSPIAVHCAVNIKHLLEEDESAETFGQQKSDSKPGNTSGAARNGGRVELITKTDCGPLDGSC